jgi:hypothetical protein
MNNKFEMSVGTIVTIVLSVTLLVLFFFFLQAVFSREPEIRITETKCSIVKEYYYPDYMLENKLNEIEFDFENNCYIYTKYQIVPANVQLCKNILIEKNKVLDLMNLQREEFLKNNTGKEVCEDVEVSREDIENKKLNETDNIITDLSILAFLDMKYKDKLIWLDENTECISCWSDKKDIGSYDGQCNGSYPFDMEICSEYKTGKYKIEVLE